MLPDMPGSTRQLPYRLGIGSSVSSGAVPRRFLCLRKPPQGTHMRRLRRLFISPVHLAQPGSGTSGRRRQQCNRCSPCATHSRRGAIAMRIHLAHLGREVGCTDVHLFGDVLSDHVDHKAAGAPDVAGCVFGNKRVPRPIRYAYSDDGRIGTKWWHALKGAAFSRPSLFMLVINAIGRGAARPTSSL